MGSFVAAVNGGLALWLLVVVCLTFLLVWLRRFDDRRDDTDGDDET